MKITKKHTILWADDDPDDLLIIREVLNRLNDSHDMVEAVNGRQALNYLNEVDPSEYPCIIVLDINMPILNGKETLSYIKKEEKYKAIPVVVFSTSDSEADISFCRHMGVQLFTKPSSFTAMKEVVQKMLSYCVY